MPFRPQEPGNDHGVAHSDQVGLQPFERSPVTWQVGLTARVASHEADHGTASIRAGRRRQS